jgi:excisionase family DNA binding protein
MQTERPAERRVSLSVKQYAERHGVCTRTVHRWIKSGRIPVHRFSKRTLRIVLAVRNSDS